MAAAYTDCVSKYTTACLLSLLLSACSASTDGGGAAEPDVPAAAPDVPAAAPDVPAAPPDVPDVPETTPDVPAPPPEAVYQTIDVQTLNEWLEGEPDFLLINVHIPYAGEIPGTDAHVPFNDLAKLIAALDSDKGRKAVLYCLSGPMSLKATNQLVDLGYWNLYDLPEAMLGWKAAGYPFTAP